MKKYAYLFLVLMTMSACSTECLEKEDVFYDVDPIMKSSVPYQNGQTVHFERGGEIYGFEVDFKLDTLKDVWFNCEDCCTDTLFLIEEQLIVELFDSLHQFRFKLYCPHTSRSMHLSVQPFTSGQYANAASRLNYQLTPEGTFICNYDSVFYFTGTICHDSITIGTKLYYNVAEIVHKYGWFHDVDQLFYSQEKGIIKVTFRGNIAEQLVLVE